MANVVLFAGRIFLVVFLFIFLFALIKTGGFTLGQRKKEYSFKSAKNELTMSRRTTELFLLFAALPIVVLLFAMLVFTQTDVEPSTMGVPLIIFALFLIAHFAVRNLAPKADQAILPIAFALTGIGMAFITRINTGYVTQQLVLLAFGIGVFIAVLVVVKSIDKFTKYEFLMAIAGIVLLLSPAFPGLGTDYGSGSKIWLTIGSFSFQPGEIAKIAIVLFLASYLSKNCEMLSSFTWKIRPFAKVKLFKKVRVFEKVRLFELPDLPDFRSWFPLLGMWAIAIFIVVFEKDLGWALVLFFTLLIMFYFATGRKFYPIIGLLLAAISGVQIAGKTGTAELDDSNNCWFVGMGPSDDSSVVVAIVIEDGESGIAASRAKGVFEAALHVQGVL